MERSGMVSPAGVVIREMGGADIPAGLALCRASGWNQTAHDWQYFLTAAPHGALVAVEHAVVVGTVATMPYGPFTWISMVLVDPAARGRGVGRVLLERGLALVRETDAARLDATPAGEVLYRKLGFTAEYGLARVVRHRGGAPAPGATSQAPGARPFGPGDWPAILDLDARAFGASRARLLERLAGEAPEYAWVIAPGGRVAGYLFGRHGHLREHLGPLVADSGATAAQLLDACLASFPDRSFLLDVPDAQEAWSGTLARLGFAIERPFLRMWRGPRAAMGEASQVYAVTGPEFG